MNLLYIWLLGFPESLFFCVTLSQTTERNRHKRPNKIVTNDRTKSSQTTEKLENIWIIQYKYGLIEVKLGGEKLINDGADALNTFADTIDTTKMRKPSFKMVLTAVGPYAYQRPDGIFVVPIGCLKD